VSTNLGLNLLRTLKRRREQILDFPPEPDWENEESAVPGWMIDSVTSRPDIALELAERRATLWRFVDDLPEEKRDVVRLIHEADMEIREVAETLGVPEGTVKSRLHHARRRLAREWTDYESDWEE
jgi:RNA polymerase sigma-70 factor (ECF subfamily)